MEKICIVGASGKLGQYLVEHVLTRNYKVVGVCREESVEKLGRFKEKVEIVPGKTNDRNVIREADICQSSSLDCRTGKRS